MSTLVIGDPAKNAPYESDTTWSDDVTCQRCGVVVCACKSYCETHAPNVRLPPAWFRKNERPGVCGQCTDARGKRLKAEVEAYERGALMDCLRDFAKRRNATYNVVDGCIRLHLPAGDTGVMVLAEKRIQDVASFRALTLWFDEVLAKAAEQERPAARRPILEAARKRAEEHRMQLHHDAASDTVTVTKEVLGFLWTSTTCRVCDLMRIGVDAWYHKLATELVGAHERMHERLHAPQWLVAPDMFTPLADLSLGPATTTISSTTTVPAGWLVAGPTRFQRKP
jgi:hypothetical protein